MSDKKRYTIRKFTLLILVQLMFSAIIIATIGCVVKNLASLENSVLQLLICGTLLGSLLLMLLLTLLSLLAHLLNRVFYNLPLRTRFK